MFRKFFTRLFILGLFTALVACGGKGGFQIGSLTSGDGGNNGSSAGDDNTGTNPSPAPAPNEFQKLQYKGYVSGGNNDGNLAIDIDKTSGALLLILPLQLNSFISSTEGEVPDLPGLKFMTYKDETGASFMAITVPLRYVLKGASFLSPARLPNGDALPQVAGGELPSVAVTLPGKNKVRLHLYVGVNAVGVYVSSPFDPYLPLQYPIRKGVETIGQIYAVPAKSGFDGGFFLNTQMPESIAAVIDDHFRF